MGGSESRRPRPSYEGGHFRDPKIAEAQIAQSEEEARADFDALIGAAKPSREARGDQRE